MKKALVWAAVTVAVLASSVTGIAAQSGEASGSRDDFDGSVLDSEWTLRDGYANQFPADVANHAGFQLSDGHLEISIPGGAEHNQWWLREAAALRPYEGSGVYETKVDSDYAGNVQFGITFESSPGTFMQFMLYGNRQLRGYVERFVQMDGYIQKATFAEFGTGVFDPDVGPFFLRVAVDDHDDHTQRTWNFEWSRDGVTWLAGASGVFEGSAPQTDVGDITSVGVFAGNHPSAFTAFDARFDYFYSSGELEPVPLLPPTVTAVPGSDRIDLAWTEVLGPDEYRVYRSTSASGPFALIAESADPLFGDTDVVAGTTYHYTVSVVRGGVESALSAAVSASPVGVPPPPPPSDGIPLDGLALALDASDLSLANGAAVSSWVDGSGNAANAVASGSSRPTFVSSGVGGVPSVRFDGVDDHFELADGFEDFTDGMSMYVVAQPSALQSGYKMVALGNGANQANIVLGRAGRTSGLQYFTSNSAGKAGWFNTGAALSTTSPSVYAVQQPGGAVNATVTATVSHNGTVVGSGNVYVPPVTTRGTNYIGRSYWNDGWFQGDIAEIIIYDRALSAAEQATVAAYLHTKYGL